MTTGIGCYTCELSSRRRAGQAPPWDDIARFAYWDLAHAFNTSLPGWLVLIVNRHVSTVADLTAAEATELGELVQRVSVALTAVVGCTKTYVVQFAESAGHQHVHVHVIPRAADLPADLTGPGIFRLLGVPEDQRVPEPEMNRLAIAVRPALGRFLTRR